MANDIETQAKEFLERVEASSMALQSLGHVGTCMNGSFRDAEAFYNVVEFLTDLNNDYVAEMKAYFEDHVLSAVVPPPASDPVKGKPEAAAPAGRPGEDLSVALP